MYTSHDFPHFYFPRKKIGKNAFHSLVRPRIRVDLNRRAGRPKRLARLGWGGFLWKKNVRGFFFQKIRAFPFKNPILNIMSRISTYKIV
jgi:hypothetical protein